MKLDGKNKHKSKICDGNNWTGYALFGGVGGDGNSEKLEKMKYLNLRTGDRILMKLNKKTSFFK